MDGSQFESNFCQNFVIAVKIWFCTLNGELDENVKKLLDLGIGDTGRLEFVLSSLQKGKKIYNSDMKYVESLITKTLSDKKEESGTKITCSDSLESKEIPLKDSKMSKNPVQFNESSSKKQYKSVKVPRENYTPYGITYHVSGRNEVKIHHNSCRFYRNASQSGSTKWVFRNGYQNAKQDAASIANRQSTYYKPAQCCLNGIINRSVSAALFVSLFPFFGLLGNVIIRDYYPTLGKGLKYFGLVYGILVIIMYVANTIRHP